jgi:Ser/Thr protein kinase RdoA (MazF antagonist)
VLLQTVDPEGLPTVLVLRNANIRRASGSGHTRAAAVPEVHQEMFPTCDSNLRADALVRQVLVHYRISEVTRCRFHARGLNDTYKVETSGNKSYFLRIYRTDWRTREEIEAELAVLQHLARCNVNVSVPIIRADDTLLTPLDCAEGKRWAALFTAAPGDEVDFKTFTEDQARRYGETAAAIHCAADGLAEHFQRAALDLNLLLDGPLSLIMPVIAHRRDDLAYVADLAKRLRSSVENATGLEKGFCHGDLHGHNAGYAGEAFTVYDFDYCGWGYRAYDLSVFPWAFAIGEQAPERIESMGRAFLTGYVRHRAIKSVNIAAIPTFVAIRQIWLTGLHIGLADRFGWGWLNDRYFDRQFKVLRNWQKNFLDRPTVDWLTRA